MISELVEYLGSSKDANQLIAFWDKQDEKPIETRNTERFHHFIIKQTELKSATNFNFLVHFIANTLQHVNCKERMKIIFAARLFTDEAECQYTLQRLIAGLSTNDSQTLLNLLIEQMNDTADEVRAFAVDTKNGFTQIIEINHRYQQNFINIVQEHPFVFAAELLYPYANHLMNALHRTVTQGSRNALSVYLVKLSRLPYTLALPLTRLAFNALSEMCEAWPETLATSTLNHEIILISYSIQQLLLIEASEQILKREGCRAYPKVHGKILSNIICVHQEDYIDLLHHIENVDSASLYEVFVLAKLIEKIYEITLSIFPKTSDAKQRNEVEIHLKHLEEFMSDSRFSLNHFINDRAFATLSTPYDLTEVQQNELFDHFTKSIKSGSNEILATYIDNIKSTDTKRTVLEFMLKCVGSKYFQNESYQYIKHIESYCIGALDMLALKAEEELVDDESKINPTMRKKRKKKKKKKKESIINSDIEAVHTDPHQSSSSTGENGSIATSAELAELNHDDLQAELRMSHLAARKVSLYQYYIEHFNRLNDIIFTAPKADAECYLKLHHRIRGLLEQLIIHYSKHIVSNMVRPLITYEMKVSTTRLADKIRMMPISLSQLENAFRLHNQLITALFNDLPAKGFDEYAIEEIDIRQNIDEFLFMPKCLMNDQQLRTIEWLHQIVNEAEERALETTEFSGFKPGFLVGGVYGSFVAEMFTRIYYQPETTASALASASRAADIDCIIFIDKQFARDNTITIMQMASLRSIMLSLLKTYERNARFLNGITTWHDIEYKSQPCDITLQENAPIPVLSHCALLYRLNDGVIKFLENGQHTLQHLRSNRVQIIAPAHQHLDHRVMAHVLKKIVAYLANGAKLTVNSKQILGVLFNDKEQSIKTMHRLLSYYCEKSPKTRELLTLNPTLPIIIDNVESEINLNNFILSSAKDPHSCTKMETIISSSSSCLIKP